MTAMTARQRRVGMVAQYAEEQPEAPSGRVAAVADGFDQRADDPCRAADPVGQVVYGQRPDQPQQAQPGMPEGKGFVPSCGRQIPTRRNTGSLVIVMWQAYLLLRRRDEA
jgi:hypothetical protein